MSIVPVRAKYFYFSMWAMGMVPGLTAFASYADPCMYQTTPISKRPKVLINNS